MFCYLFEKNLNFNLIIESRLQGHYSESIVLEPDRIALKYWTSNELRDESLSHKNKKPSDSKSGASVIPFQTTQVSSILPSSIGKRDEVVSCPNSTKGRGGGLGSCTLDLTDIKLENQSKQKLAGLQLSPKSTSFYEIPL
ncbi:hypothetical protein EBR03_02550 [bacterium]|nr:hypothetical protein [bacterium]NBW98432.1 hypothetical protein [bacterium]